MRTLLIATLSILALTFSFTACGKKDGGGEKAATAAAPAGGAHKEAMTKWDTLCASCHGKTGAGDGAASAALNPKPRALNDAAWQKTVDDAHLAKVILEGGPAVGLNAIMPPNPDLKGKPEVVDALVAHIRSLDK